MTPKRETWRTYMLRDVKRRNEIRPRGHQIWQVQLCADKGLYRPIFRVGFRGEAQWEMRWERRRMIKEGLL